MPDSKTDPIADPITYRRFTLDDVAAAHALTVELKWPHRADDWKFVAQLGVGFVAEDASGVIGTALCWKYGADCASLGMVIVSPARQGLGIGRKLMELLLEELGGRITLSCTRPPPVRRSMKSSGFARRARSISIKARRSSRRSLSLPAGERLRPLRVETTPRASSSWPRRQAAFDRGEVLAALLENADGIALDRDGELVGFALFRRFGRGFAIGPVVAPASEDSSRAKALISHWLALNEGVFVRASTRRATAA